MSNYFLFLPILLPMISDSRLQIKLLSKSGELLNCVNCFPGQVTVLRANAENDLLPYQRALAGIPGPERFSITIDRETFDPNQNILVGFGERIPPQVNVATLFEQVGVSGDALNSLLVNYGLEAYAQKVCGEITECATRRIQLLLGTLNSARIMILNDPFEPISISWRERMAELILNDTVSKQRIVVLPRLSYRPQIWVGNEAVARIQVGTTIQKTIGFGSASSDVNSMVNQMRELLKDENAVKQLIESQAIRVPSGAVNIADLPTLSEPQSHTRVNSGALISPIPRAQSGAYAIPAQVPSDISSQAKSPPWTDRLKVALLRRGIEPRLAFTLAGACLVLITVIGDMALTKKRTIEIQPVVLAKIEAPTQETKIVPAAPPKLSTEVKTEPEQGKDLVVAKIDHLPEDIVPVKVEVAPPAPKTIIDTYPPEIRNAILRAFNGSGTGSTEHISLEQRPIEPQLNAAQSKSPFADLKNIPSSVGASHNGDQEMRGESYNDGTDQMGGVPQIEQERQEQIRQKFLEAINRAVDARDDGSQGEY